MPEPELSVASAPGLPEQIHSVPLAGRPCISRRTLGGPRRALRVALTLAASSQERTLRPPSASGGPPRVGAGWVVQAWVGLPGEGASETRSAWREAGGETKAGCSQGLTLWVHSLSSYR